MNDQFRTLTGARAERLDSASMQVNQALNQRQPHAEAALHPIFAAHLGEQLEDLLDILGQDADAGVAHPQYGLLARAGEPELNAPAGLGVFGRVVQQIGEYLGQAGKVALHVQRFSGRFDVELVAQRVDERTACLHSCEHRLGEIERLQLQLDSAASDARHVEQIIHETRELLDLPLDDVQAPLPLRFIQLRLA